jgi:long-chain acyl-CoA synthetase
VAEVAVTTAAEKVRSGEAAALVDLLRERVEQEPARIALRVKRLGLWEELSWAAYGKRVRDLTAGLAAVGVKAGDAVAVMAEATAEAVAVDLAVQAIGAATLPINPYSSMSDVRYLVDHGGATLLVIGDLETVDRLRAAAELDGAAITTAIILEGTATREVRDWRLFSFAELNALGAGSERRESLGDVVGTRTAQERIALHPTAGTTAHPRLTAISSENMEAAWTEFLTGLSPTRRDSFVVETPPYHVTGHASVLLLPLLFGAVAHFPEHPAAVEEAMAEVAPTISIALPQRWESRAADLTARVRESGFIHRLAYGAAVAAQTKVSAGEPAGGPQRALAAAARWLVLDPIRRKLGLHRLRAAAVGGRYMPPDLLEFWRRVGVPLIEFYGTTEACGLIAFQTSPHAAAGTGMRPHSGVSVKIGGGGEVTISGRAVATAEAGGHDSSAHHAGRDARGWVGTGDRGLMSDDLLNLSYRLSDVVEMSGREVPIGEIERILFSQGHIRYVAVVGRGRPHLAALIELDYPSVAAWARTNSVRYGSLGSLAENQQVRELIESAVDASNRSLEERGLPRVEGFKILSATEGFESTNVLALTGAIRRGEVETRYKPSIESLYSEPGGQRRKATAEVTIG